MDKVVDMTIPFLAVFLVLALVASAATIGWLIGTALLYTVE